MKKLLSAVFICMLALVGCNEKSLEKDFVNQVNASNILVAQMNVIQSEANNALKGESSVEQIDEAIKELNSKIDDTLNPYFNSFVPEEIRPLQGLLEESANYALATSKSLKALLDLTVAANQQKELDKDKKGKAAAEAKKVQEEQEKAIETEADELRETLQDYVDSIDKLNSEHKAFVWKHKIKSVKFD